MSIYENIFNKITIYSSVNYNDEFTEVFSPLKLQYFILSPHIGTDFLSYVTLS